MIKLQSKTNVDPPDSEYIYGSIRDQAGTTEGTPVNEEVYQDAHQFLERLMRLSDLVPNDLPDNEYNGWQLWDALVRHLGGAYQNCKLRCSQSGTNDPTIAHVGINTIAQDGGDGITSFTRALTGRYDLVFAQNNLSLTNTYTYSASEAGFSGFVNFSVTATNTIRVETRDATGALSDSILANTMIFIEVLNDKPTY